MTETMATAARRVFPDASHPATLVAPLVAVGLAAVVLRQAGHEWVASGLWLTLAVAAGLALHVDLPWGGRLTLGHAILVAIVARVDPQWAVLIAVAGIVLSLPSWLDHEEEGSVGARLGGAGAVVAAVAAAIAGRLVADALLPWNLDAEDAAMAVAAIVGVAFLGVDHAIRGVVARTTGERSDLRQAWPLYVTLLCVAVLIDLAADQGIALAFIAAVPLLVTRFAFQRYTSARITYEQTTRALSLLPEVAGLTPLGHSERTAVYVEAVADAMGYDGKRLDHLVNAARLHHIGHISLHEEAERDGPPDPADLADVSGDILQETGFLGDLVDLVQDSQPGGPPASSVEAAIIRVCSMLDELVEVDHEVDPFAALVAMHPVGHERRVAIEVLNLSHRNPGLIAQARAGVELMHQIAAKAEAAGHHDH
ncbi:MAG TPA: hypothetical protein VM345_09090 [Acidimicrobiales bacterium]|nr:hypothetical protein [Acidimicrobiales bacterium]